MVELTYLLRNTVSTLTPSKPLNSSPAGRPNPRRCPGPIYLPANIDKLLSDAAIKELKKHNATSRSTPPPKRLSIPMTLTLNPIRNPLKLPPVCHPSRLDNDLDNTEPCEAFTLDDSTLEHLMDAYSPHCSICRNTPILSQNKHEQTCNGHITCLGLCRVENLNPNKLEPPRKPIWMVDHVEG